MITTTRFQPLLFVLLLVLCIPVNAQEEVAQMTEQEQERARIIANFGSWEEYERCKAEEWKKVAAALERGYSTSTTTTIATIPKAELQMKIEYPPLPEPPSSNHWIAFVVVNGIAALLILWWLLRTREK
jgi:hypothetical protein